MHVDARRPQAGLAHHHLGRPRPAARPGHPGRGDEPAPRRQPVSGRADAPRPPPGRRPAPPSSRSTRPGCPAGSALADLPRRAHRHRDRRCTHGLRQRLDLFTDVAARGPVATRPRPPPSCPGILLLLLAHALRRRKRRAWRAAVRAALRSASSCTWLKAEPLAATLAARSCWSLLVRLPGRVPRPRRPAHPVAGRPGVRRCSPSSAMVLGVARGRAAPERPRRRLAVGLGRCCSTLAYGLVGVDGPLTFRARAGRRPRRRACCSGWA